MKQVLRKRIPRQLIDNWPRYLALTIIIIMCMYIVISLVGAAENIIQGTEKAQEESHLEDGQVTTFVPLLSNQIKKIEEKGVTFEDHISFDATADEDGSVIRVFKNRNSIDTVIIEEGKLADSLDEVVLEKRYCEVHEISVGDIFAINGQKFKVSGIGVTVDYDMIVRKFSDTAVDSVCFGTAFLTEEGYNKLLKSLGEIQQEYTYAFILNDAITPDELKDIIKNFEFDYKTVDDKYYREMLEDTYGKRDEIKDGIDELYDGTQELKDGIKELKDGTKELNDGLYDLYDGTNDLKDGVKELKDGTKDLSDGVDELYDGAVELHNGTTEFGDGFHEFSDGMEQLKDGGHKLSDGLNELDGYSKDIASGSSQIFNGMITMVENSINEALSPMGMTIHLTRDNYEEELTNLIATLKTYGKTSEAAEIGELKGSLDSIAKYVEGVKEYTDGVGQVEEGSDELVAGISAALEGTKTLDEAAIAIDDGFRQLRDGIKELQDGTKDFSDGVNELYDGSVELSDGAKEAYDGSIELFDGIEELEEGVDEMADGVEDFREDADEMLDKIFKEQPDNITSFILKENNIRIGGAAGDVVINKHAGMVAGIILMVLLTYVLSVFVIHQIQGESSVIGALYAMGVKKRDLIGHYITLPTMVSLIGGLVGALVGFSKIGVPVQMKDSYSYFSIPRFEMLYPLYLIIYAVIMPPVVSLIVNTLVINKSLSRTALSLIKNEQKITTGANVNLGRLGFLRRFQIRQLIREKRTALTITFGMLVSLLICMLGMDCMVLCSHIAEDNAKDTKYEYMYTYKYPEKEVPAGGEACYIESLQREKGGYTLDISIIGIDDDNKYYDVTTVKGNNNVIASEGICTRYEVGVGDKLILSDSTEDKDYVFTIAGITDYSVGLSLFMDIDTMREYFDEDKDYFNVVLSERELNVEEGRLYSVTTRDDIAKASAIFVKLMKSMVITMIGASLVILFIVMYLMTGVMIDRASFGIALVKIFGFRTGELRKLYLDGNALIVAVSSIVSIPVSKKLMDMIFPSFIANVACAINLHFKWYYYLLVFGGIMISYIAISQLMLKKLKKVIPAEVLKNRE